MLKSEVGFIDDNFDKSTNIWFLDFLSIGKSVGWWSQEALAGKQRNGTRFYYGNDCVGQKNKMEWFTNTGSHELGAGKESGTKSRCYVFRERRWHKILSIASKIFCIYHPLSKKGKFSLVNIFLTIRIQNTSGSDFPNCSETEGIMWFKRPKVTSATSTSCMNMKKRPYWELS